jgi:hypothetical protein
MWCQNIYDKVNFKKETIEETGHKVSQVRLFEN